ncbi:expressed unknown protein [Seminavis robusta]|uniref:Transmembrane protein n=1 Tax=Seminavis robusta TaxID=568900 RepID=A0A9N8EUZ6_9STRA|nr:expressed unknown protein [Seminavis robusta]|eukprot:Sro1901_g304360.1 n/a (137) ;mRNA; f:14263-14673
MLLCRFRSTIFLIALALFSALPVAHGWILPKSNPRKCLIQPQNYQTTVLLHQTDQDDLQPDDNNNSIPQKELRIGPFGSLEILAVAVSLFFVASVAVYGDALFAKPASNMPVVVDANEVLQSDFVRIESSVPFAGE